MFIRVGDNHDYDLINPNHICKIHIGGEFGHEDKSVIVLVNGDEIKISGERKVIQLINQLIKYELIPAVRGEITIPE